MEQLIYIEQNDKIEASKMAKGFTIEDTRIRAYVNALGTELATKYLAQENINIANIHNMHSINKIRESFDIADIMLPNIHIDVRVVYDENLIFIPKTHFEYGLTPDIYLVFKMADEATHVSFLGFFEPKLINKNNSNNEYYFIEKEKLSHPSDLKSYIETFNGNTTESLTEEEMESAQRLAIALIDDDITESDKKSLISTLKRSASLRENLIEFDNFEWISYHTANNQDFENIEIESNDEEILISESPVLDEFDAFETADEFEEFDEPAVEPVDTDIVAETLSSIDYIQNGHTIEDITTDIDSLEDFENSTPVEDLDNLDNVETLETPIDFEDTNIDSIEEIIPEDAVENVSFDEEIVDTVEEEQLIEEFIESTEEPVAEFDNELATENIEPEITLEQDDEIFETENIADEGIQTEEDLEIFDEMFLSNEYEDAFGLDTEEPIEELSTEFETEELSTTINTEINTEIDTEVLKEVTESVSTLPDIENEEKATTDTETADIIDALLSDDMLANLPEMDEVSNNEDNYEEDVITNSETTPLMDIEPAEVEPIIENTSEEIPLESFNNIEDLDSNTNTSNSEAETEKFSFNDLGQSDEYSLNGIVVEPSGTVSFDNLAEEFNENDELAEQFDDTKSLESLNSLTIENDVENKESDDTDFLNSLVTETEQPDNQIIPTVFENSTIITNENITAGEIPIDINEPISEEILDEEMKKLEVLYNQSNNGFNFDTNSSEKGHKGIVALGIILTVVAVLFSLGFMKKSNEKTTQNTKPNVVSKNIPETLDKNIPKLPEQKVPATSKANIPNALTPIDPDGIEKVTPKISEKEKVALDKAVKEAKAELAKPKKPIETPYLDVQKLSWSVPDYLSYNDQFKRYLQTAGKSLKLSLSSDLLLATEYAYSNQINVDVTLTKEGNLKDAKIVQSSGSSEIDAIVLRTVKETLNVVKAPAGLIVGTTANLTLKIYL